MTKYCLFRAPGYWLIILCVLVFFFKFRFFSVQILTQYPTFEPYLTEIWPKKEPARLVKCHEKIEILVVSHEPLFFKQRDGPWFPNLRLLHAYPFLLPIQIVDKGAIKFILSGAHIMCPGLTSKGAFLNMETDKGAAVQVGFQTFT